jgi:hypothetical protein
MSYLNLLRASVTSFFTPKKEKDDQELRRRQRLERDRQLMPPPPIVRPFKLDNKNMSPITKTNEWFARGSLSPSGSPSMPKTPTVLGPNTEGAKIEKNKRAFIRRPRAGSAEQTYTTDAEEDDYDSEDYDIDGPTLVAQNLPKTPKTPRAGATPRCLSQKKSARHFDSFRPGSEDDEDENLPMKAYQLKRLKDSKNEVLAENSLEAVRQYAENLKLPDDQHWNETEEALFKQLALRGFLALFPNNWVMDFRTFPASFFARKIKGEMQEPICYPMHGSDFRGTYILPFHPKYLPHPWQLPTNTRVKFSS